MRVETQRSFYEIVLITFIGVIIFNTPECSPGITYIAGVSVGVALGQTIQDWCSPRSICRAPRKIIETNNVR